MKKVPIQGIIVPVVTPMRQDESIDEDQLRFQVERLIGAGVHGIFACGTNGESYALSEKERERVTRVVAEQTAGRIPVFAGSGCVTTRQTVELSKRLQDQGADVLSIVSPWFAAASQDGLYAHYMEAARNVELPIVLYNIPARTGNPIAPETVERLALDAPNIVGVKDSSGNFDNMKQYMERTAGLKKDFCVLSGNDALILPNLVFGGRGGIAGCANVFPHTMVEIYEAWRAGDLERAQRAQDSIRTLRNCFKYGNPNTIIKSAVAMLGYPVGACRRPFGGLSEEAVRQLRQAMQKCRENGLH